MQGRQLVTRRGGSPVTRWEVAIGAPDPRLRGLTDPYAGYRERAAYPVLRREIPVPRVMMIIGLGPPLTVATAERPAAGPQSMFVAGLTQGPTFVTHAGSQCCVELSLTPLGAYRLFGVRMSALTGHMIDLDELWGREAVELQEQLTAALDWQTRFDLIDQILLRKAAGGREPDPELVGAWHRLDRQHGDLTIGELLNDTGWSRPRLAQRFREQAGLTPKGIARVMRLTRAARLITEPAGRSPAEIALSCGFYDQSHLNREFRALAGCTPLEYRAARLLPTLVGIGAASPAGDQGG